MLKIFTRPVYQLSVHSIPYHSHITNTVVQHGTRIFLEGGAGGATANVSEKMFEVLAQNLHHILSRIL